MFTNKMTNKMWILILVLAYFSNVHCVNGKSSLAFVFDTTGSMQTDLDRARDGASQILSKKYPDRNNITTTDSTSCITIFKMETEDEGQYECEAVNDLGIDVGKIEVRSTRTITTKKKLYVALGSSPTFECCDQITDQVLDWSSMVWSKEKSNTTFDDEFGSTTLGRDVTELSDSWKFNVLGNGSYSIRYVTPDDNGVYSFYNRDAPEIIHSQIYLFVGLSPQFPNGLPEKTEITIASGGMAYINCSVSNRVWLKNNETITSMNITKPRLCRKSNMLCANESGLYECVIRNEYGTNSRKFKVVVIEKPKLMAVSPVMVSSMSELILPCEILKGERTAKRIWSFGNGTKIFDGSKRNPYIMRNINVDEDGTLSIEGITLDYPENYNCTVINIAGSSSMNVHVLVSDYPEWRRR